LGEESDMEIIRLENIGKIYGKDSYKTIALQNVNLKINAGEFVSIMGASGSGKSTLLNIIGCMDIPTSGSYYLKGSLVNGYGNSKLSKIRGSVISFVFQHFALLNEYTVYENVELPLLNIKISRREKKERIYHYLEQLKIKDLANKKPTQISGGQQQRVAIARALVSEPEIILADEPTGALDQKTGIELLEIMKAINNEGKTLIIVTHDNKVASYSKRIITITDGKIDSDVTNNSDLEEKISKSS